MSEAMHPAAPHYLPSFITGPGETDVLFTGVVIFLVLAVMGLGSLYFWLHALPERMSHGAGQRQFQLVAVLSLLALFTHIQAFWIAALILALVPVPDFWTPLASMADSLTKMAMRWSRSAADRQHEANLEPKVAPHIGKEINGSDLRDEMPSTRVAAASDDQFQVAAAGVRKQ